jgi:DNA-binding transcriptional regulator LsrR (DeoR family)
MPEQRISGERIDILADVAEMYYLANKTQAQIAKEVGVTRSMVSRMLSDARRLGIVEINVNRPLQFDEKLEQDLTQRFHIKNACVVERKNEDESRLLPRVGLAGSFVLKDFLKDDTVLGLAWGTAVSAVVDALDVDEPAAIKVVQLVGALGSSNQVYDAHMIVQRLVEKVGGEGLFMFAPFIVDSPEVAQALISNPGLAEVFRLIRRCSVALLGIGSIDPEYSSFYHAGYVPKKVLQELAQDGAVGDVCGRHFDINGKLLDNDFNKRVVSIEAKDLFRIPNRIAIAGGSGKVRPILGALRGGWVNIIVTDSVTAKEIIMLDEGKD